MKRGFWILIIVILAASAFLVGGVFAKFKHSQYKKEKEPEPKVTQKITYPPTYGQQLPKIDEKSIPGGQYQEKTKVPILMYHYIREMPGSDDPTGQKLSVTPANFKVQMASVKSAGYQTTDFDALRSGALPPKPLILTFDDGYDDAYTQVFPVLKKNGFKGVFYIVTGFIGKEGYLTWAQIEEMANGGMIIGSHTLNHLDLSSKKLSSANLVKQVQLSKSTLEEKLGRTVNDFCYPYGGANNQAIEEVYAAGYKTATSTKGGVVQSGSYWLYLPRRRVANETNLEKLLGGF